MQKNLTLIVLFKMNVTDCFKILLLNIMLNLLREYVEDCNGGGNRDIVIVLVAFIVPELFCII